MAPKKNPQCNHPDRKPSGKGKQRAKAPSHHNEGNPVDPSNRPSGSDQRFLLPKRSLKSKSSQSRRKQRATCRPMTRSLVTWGDQTRKGLVDHFLKLPRATTTVNPGSNTIGARARPSTMDVSPLPSLATQWCDDFLLSASSLLQPLVCDNNSSSASFRGSKRRQEPSPQPRRQHSHAALRLHGGSPPRHSITDQQVQHHQEEIHSLQTQLPQEFHLGYTGGRAQGFEEAMEMANSPIATTAPPHDHCEPQESHGPHESHDDHEH
jgi:hypothetical protein